MSTSTGATPCRLATRAAKEPAIRDGPSLGGKRRESRDDRKLRTSRPGRLWLFTHSLLFPGGQTPTPRWPVAGLRSGSELKAGHGEPTEPGQLVIAVALVDVHYLVDLADDEDIGSQGVVDAA